MCILQSSEGPQLRRHLVALLNANLNVFQHASPDLPDLGVLFPLLQAFGQELEAFALLAQESAQTLLNARFVLFFALLVHSLNFLVCQAIFLHESDQVEVVLPQLPSLQVLGSVFLFVLAEDCDLVGLVLPVKEVAANTICIQVAKSLLKAGFASRAPVSVLPHLVEVGSQFGLCIVFACADEHCSALQLVLPIPAVLL